MVCRRASGKQHDLSQANRGTQAVVRVCGGCRARAFAISGDYLAAEPFCTYEPVKAR